MVVKMKCLNCGYLLNTYLHSIIVDNEKMEVWLEIECPMCGHKGLRPMSEIIHNTNGGDDECVEKEKSKLAIGAE